MNKLYSGSAKVVAVVPRELHDYQKKGMTEDEALASFNLVLKVQPCDESFGEAEIEIEFSSREGSGKFAGKKQTEISLETLVQQKLISEAKLEFVSGLYESVGKTVQIYQKDSSNGKYVNTYFSSATPQLSANELQKRLAMLTGKAVAKPAAQASDNPFA